MLSCPGLSAHTLYVYTYDVISMITSHRYLYNSVHLQYIGEYRGVTVTVAISMKSIMVLQIFIQTVRPDTDQRIINKWTNFFNPFLLGTNLWTSIVSSEFTTLLSLTPLSISYTHTHSLARLLIHSLSLNTVSLSLDPFLSHSLFLS